MLPTCLTWDACTAHAGKSVRVVGVYTLEAPAAGLKGGAAAKVARVIPEGGRRGPWLEPYWHPNSVRPDAELERYAGRLVAVTGTLYLSGVPAPNPDAASVGGACLHPVESIELVPE